MKQSLIIPDRRELSLLKILVGDKIAIQHLPGWSCNLRRCLVRGIGKRAIRIAVGMHNSDEFPQQIILNIILHAAYQANQRGWKSASISLRATRYRLSHKNGYEVRNSFLLPW